MFCNKCGAACNDNAAFCNTCGNPLQAAPQQAPQQPVYQQPVYQQPAQPVYQQPVYQQPAQQPYQNPYQRPANYEPFDLKKSWHVIIALVAVFALVMGILTTFCILELPVTGRAGGESDSDYVEFADIADMLDAWDKSPALLYVGNILFGLINFGIAIAGFLYFMKKKSNMPHYDMYVGRIIKKADPTFTIGILGAAGALVQFLLFLLVGFKKYGVKYSFGVPWLTWVALGIYAVVALADKFYLNKKTY